MLTLAAVLGAVVFDSVYSKLEKDLEEKRHELARIAQLANEAYEQRDAAQTKLMGLRQQVARERMEFEDEWRMLGKVRATGFSLPRLLLRCVCTPDLHAPPPVPRVATAHRSRPGAHVPHRGQRGGWRRAHRRAGQPPHTAHQRVCVNPTAARQRGQ